MSRSVKEDISSFIAANDKTEFTTRIIVRVVPFVLSACVTLITVMNIDVFYELTPFLTNFAFDLLMFCIMLAFVLVLFTLLIRVYELVGVKAEKQFCKTIAEIDRRYEQQRHYTVIIREDVSDPPRLNCIVYSDVHRKKTQSLKLALLDLSNVAFVILFPSGLYDVLYGTTIQRFGWSNESSTIMLGFTLIVVSIATLVLTVKREFIETKKELDTLEERVSSHLRSITSKLNSSDEVIEFLKQ